jgi:hypothetical protein
MKLLYVSVHQILEFDDLCIFATLGHEVFPLGVYFGGRNAEPFRPMPTLYPDLPDDLALFERLGGRYRYGAPAAEQSIPREFVQRFDAIIVMHDLDFIETHWEAIAAIPVIWRSIGVGTQHFEPRVKAFRARGGKIVRYCPMENRADGYAGHDAIIRFGKPANALPRARDRPDILTFSHTFGQRFPRELDFYLSATIGFPVLLGGGGNEAIEGSLGIVDFAEQGRLLAQCAVYFYAAGTYIPYTLNFMEAWLAGIPIVAIDCRTIYPEDQCRFAEIPLLIDHGVNGFLVRTPDEAAAVFRMIRDDPGLGETIGAGGAKAASALFSADLVAQKWRAFLGKFAGSKNLTG